MRKLSKTAVVQGCQIVFLFETADHHPNEIVLLLSGVTGSIYNSAIIHDTRHFLSLFSVSRSHIPH